MSKAMALLDADLPSATELSLNALAERSGLPLSTTYRLAGQLVEWGGLERLQGGGYRLARGCGRSAHWPAPLALR